MDTTQNTKKDAAGGATKQEAAGDVTLLIDMCLQPSHATQASEARPAVTEPTVQSCLSFQKQRGAHDAAPVLVLLLAVMKRR